MVMAMTIIKRRKAMNRELQHDDPIELGAASEATRGGPWGVDDFRGSLMFNNSGLAED
jgi:hypothetical protein